MARAAALLGARAAVERRDWREALQSFEIVAASDQLDPADLEALAWAYAWTGDLDRGIRTWEQGFAVYSAAAHREEAAVAAFWIAWWYIDKGNHAVAAGWYRRL